MRSAQYCVLMEMRDGDLREVRLFARSNGQAMKRTIAYLDSCLFDPASDLYAPGAYKVLSITHK